MVFAKHFLKMKGTCLLIISILFAWHSSYGQCKDSLVIDNVFSEEGSAYSVLQATMSASMVDDSLIVCSAYLFSDTIAFTPVWEHLISKQNWGKLNFEKGYYYAFIDLIVAEGNKRFIVCAIYKYQEGSNAEMLYAFEIFHCSSGKHSYSSLEKSSYDGFNHFFED